MNSMNDNIDDNKKMIDAALEDLQKFLATAGRNTTEGEVTAWQQGYIAGINRATGVNL